MSAEYNITFDWNRISTLGKVKVLVEQVVGSPSQEAITQAVEDYIESHPGSLSPLSPAVKAALLQIAEKVAYKDENGEDYYDALDAALNAKALLSITAVYTQSGTVYDTDSLDSLKADLVVTANYDDGTSAVVSSGYTLSGELTVGTSTITVTYQEKTATFTVTVTNGQLLYSLSETAFTKASKIDTGIKFESGNTYTVCVDVNPTTYPTTGSNPSNYSIFTNANTASSGYAQLSTQKYTSGSNTGTYYYGVGISWANGKNIIAQNDRIRSVIVVDTVNFAYTHYFKDITKGTSNTFTNTSTEAAICRSDNIFLGCAEGKTDLGFTGTMYDFRIYKRELSSDEITAYLNGE